MDVLATELETWREKADRLRAVESSDASMAAGATSELNNKSGNVLSARELGELSSFLYTLQLVLASESLSSILNKLPKTAMVLTVLVASPTITSSAVGSRVIQCAATLVRKTREDGTEVQFVKALTWFTKLIDKIPHLKGAIEDLHSPTMARWRSVGGAGSAASSSPSTSTSTTTLGVTQVGGPLHAMATSVVASMRQLLFLDMLSSTSSEGVSQQSRFSTAQAVVEYLMKLSPMLKGYDVLRDVLEMCEQSQPMQPFVCACDVGDVYASSDGGSCGQAEPRANAHTTLALCGNAACVMGQCTCHHQTSRPAQVQPRGFYSAAWVSPDIDWSSSAVRGEVMCAASAEPYDSDWFVTADDTHSIVTSSCRWVCPQWISHVLSAAYTGQSDQLAESATCECGAQNNVHEMCGAHNSKRRRTVLSAQSTTAATSAAPAHSGVTRRSPGVVIDCHLANMLINWNNNGAHEARNDGDRNRPRLSDGALAILYSIHLPSLVHEVNHLMADFTITGRSTADGVRSSHDRVKTLARICKIRPHIQLFLEHTVFIRLCVNPQISIARLVLLLSKTIHNSDDGALFVKSCIESSAVGASAGVISLTAVPRHFTNDQFMKFCALLRGDSADSADATANHNELLSSPALWYCHVWNHKYLVHSVNTMVNALVSAQPTTTPQHNNSKHSVLRRKNITPQQSGGDELADAVEYLAWFCMTPGGRAINSTQRRSFVNSLKTSVDNISSGEGTHEQLYKLLSHDASSSITADGAEAPAVPWSDVLAWWDVCIAPLCAATSDGSSTVNTFHTLSPSVLRWLCDVVLLSVVARLAPTALSNTHPIPAAMLDAHDGALNEALEWVKLLLV